MLVMRFGSLFLCIAGAACASLICKEGFECKEGFDDSAVSLLQVDIQRSAAAESNLYGSAQAQCGNMSCGIDPPAIHAICVALPDDFCNETGQSDTHTHPHWCSAMASQPYCVSLGAWSTYVSKGNAAPDVKCDAMSGSIFTDDYNGGWSEWYMGVDALGLRELFDKCNTGPAAATFKTSFCTFVTGSNELKSSQKSTLSSHASCP